MATISQISQAMQTILGPVADRLGWETRFSQRLSKLTGSAFVKTLVLSSLTSPELTYSQLVAGALDVGIQISPQGLQQRFSPASARLMQMVLVASVQTVLASSHAGVGILERFAGVYIRDSSVVNLPSELLAVWQGVGNCQGPTAAVKLQARLEMVHGQMAGPILQAGRAHDSHSPYQSEDLPPGSVRLGDLGYFSLEQFAHDQQQQVYSFSRYKVGTQVFAGNGAEIDLLTWLRSHSEAQFEDHFLFGNQVRFAARLLATRLPPEIAEQRRRKLKDNARKKQASVSQRSLALAEWTLIITDIPAELLSLDEALVLLAVRWQIELLSKLWKSGLQIDAWRSQNPWRILTELYAKLIGAVMMHWTFLIELWRYPQRSLWKGALVVRHFAAQLAQTLSDRKRLEQVLTHMQIYFRNCCLNKRRAHPSTSQRLMAFTTTHPGIEH